MDTELDEGADPEEVKDELLEYVEQATDPERMTPEQAYETMELLQVDLGFRMEALRAENKPDSDSW